MPPLRSVCRSAARGPSGLSRAEDRVSRPRLGHGGVGGVLVEGVPGGDESRFVLRVIADAHEVAPAWHPTSPLRGRDVFVVTCCTDGEIEEADRRAHKI